MGDLGGELKKLLQNGFEVPDAPPSTSQEVVNEQKRLAGISESAPAPKKDPELRRFTDYGQEVAAICEDTVGRIRAISTSLSKYTPTTEEIEKSAREAKELRNALKNLVYTLERTVKIGAELSNSLPR